jgi:hypothetical protein
MFQIRAKLRSSSIRLSEYKIAFANAAEANIAQAAFVWVSTAVAIIPVWSGASRATFEKLASAISFNFDNTPKTPGIDARDEGRAESEGGVFSDRARGVFSFRYSTSLEHLIFNESNDANQGGDPNVFFRLINPGPYNFVDQANDAARPVLEDFVPPNLEAFITVRQVR